MAADAIFSRLFHGEFWVQHDVLKACGENSGRQQNSELWLRKPMGFP